MKTLADFKRAMSVGSVWLRKHAQETDFVKRTVTRASSGQVWVEDESGKGSVLDFPKATEFEINSHGEAEIYYPATYRYNENGQRIEISRRIILTYKQA